MKKTIISIIVAVIATFSAMAQATVIDFDYAKGISYNAAWFDLDLDGVVDDDETKQVSGRVFFNFRDFDSAGNVLKLSVTCDNGNGEEIELDAVLKDVKFLMNTDEEGNPVYAVLNKLKEPQIVVMTIDNDTFLIVYNVAIFLN